MKYIYLFFLIFLFLTAGNFARSAEPIVLDTADIMIGTKRTQLGHVRTFRGNVKLHQGDVIVFSDKVIHYIDRNKAELIGNVRILQKNLVMSAPRIDYDGNAKMARADNGVKIVDEPTVLTARKGTYSTRDYVADFRGDVFIEDDSATIIADRVIYYRETENSDAYGNVVIRGKYSNTALTGDTVNYIPGESYTRASGSPVLFQVDTIRSGSGDSIEVEFDTLSVGARIMKAWRGSKTERYLFDDSVEITRSEVAASADSAVYFKAADRIELFGTPVVWYDSTQLHADTTIIRMEDNKLRNIRAISDAFAATREDSADMGIINQISGSEITIEFAEDDINMIHSRGGAKSLYFLIGKDGDSGADRSSCDEFKIFFEAGEPEDALWLEEVRAEFIPEKIYAGKIKEYYLPGFRWDNQRPQRKEMQLRSINKKHFE
jgi:lipopolysaccharide export system protein LptA